MKKSKLSFILLLVVSITASLLPGFTAYAAMGSVDYAVDEPAGLRRSVSTMVVRGVDFDLGMLSFDLTHGCPSGGTLKLDIRIDGITGQQIADLFSPSIESGYISYSRRTDRIPLTADVKGVHDVYITVMSGETFFHGTTFYYFIGSRSLYKPYGETQSYLDTLEFASPHKVNFLADLGILDTTLAELDHKMPVSRIRFLKALAGFYDLSDMPEVPVGIFMDVKDKTDRQIAYFLYQKGVLVLENTGYLEPNVYLKPMEAATYISNMLGFKDDIRMVSKMKAGKDSPDGYLRRDQMVDMLYNAVFQGYRVGYKTESGAFWYEDFEDESFLNYTKDYELGVGLVSSNYYTGIYSAFDATAEDTVRINDTDYSVGSTAADEFLGVYSYYIYGTDADGVETIKAIAPVNAEYITQLDSSLTFTEFSSERISYINEKNKTEEIKLLPSTSIIYNGKALDTNISTVITDPSKFRGRVIAIDNNRDKNCDVLVITNAVSIIIGGISDTYVSDVINPLITFDFTNARVEFSKNGRLATASDFKQKECVDVYASANAEGEKLYRILAGPTALEGTVVGVGADGITLDDGETYEISPYATYIGKPGDIGIFAINNFGEILYYTAATDEEISLGWLYKVILNDEDEIGFVTLKTLNNQMEKYQFAERVTVDGVKIKNYGDLKTGKSGATTAMSSFVGIIVDKPIRYKLNEEGLITVFDTADTAPNPVTTPYNSLVQLLPAGTYLGEVGVVYDNSVDTTFNGGSAAIIDGGLAFLGNPLYMFSEFSADPELFELDTFFEIQQINYQAKQYNGFYSIGSGRTVSLIAMNDYGATSGGCSPFLVQEIYTVVDKDGEVKTKVVGADQSGTVEYILMLADPTDKLEGQALQEGDIISGAVSNGLMTSLDVYHYNGNTYADGSGDTRVVDGTTLTSLMNFSQGVCAHVPGVWNDKVMVATVDKIGEDYFTLKRITEDHIEYCSLNAPVKVASVSRDGKDLDRTLSVSSLKPGQKIVGYFDYGVPTMFYIFDYLN